MFRDKLIAALKVSRSTDNNSDKEMFSNHKQNPKTKETFKYRVSESVQFVVEKRTNSALSKS